jgi:hypothetical protein
MLIDLSYCPGYRVIRVKVIFRLPHRLKHVYSGALAYVELFTEFGNVYPSNPSKLHQISHAYTNGERRAAVVWLESIHMACHLIPQFKTMPEDAWNPTQDVLETCRKFYFNHFSSHLMYAYVDHWLYDM